MVVVSKQLYDEVVKDMSCQDMLHPLSKSCFRSDPKLMLDAIIGSAKFYSVIYLVQIALQGKQLKNKKTWKKLLHYYIRSVLFGVGVASNTFIVNCILNGIGIKKTYVNTLLIPTTVSGLLIYLEPPHRRTLVMNLFYNLLIEYWLKCLSSSGYITITRSKQTLMFMIGSALLFYLMRLEGDKEKRTPLFWLYTAEKVNRKTGKSNYCPHEGPCRNHILKGSTMYFGIGLGISLARLILPRLRSPIRAISSLRWKHLKLAMFFSSYIGIYRAVTCYLCNKKKGDSALFALPAGFLAGLSMVFNPSTGMAIASLTGALKLYTTILYDKKILPAHIPLPELLFCISHGVLLTARAVDSETCPPYIKNLADTVSGGHSRLVYQRIHDRIASM